MAKTVFILGAGASQPTGTPVMANFMDTARDVFTSGKVQDSKEDFERVFSATENLQRVHSKAELDTDNIEVLFSACEMAVTLQSFPGLASAELPRLVASIRKVIVRTIEETQQFQTHPQTELRPPALYEMFVAELDKIASESTVAVLTFNYDVGLDFALSFGGFNVDYATSPENVSNPASSTIPLLKLHGSLNWWRHSNDSIEVVDLNSLANGVKLKNGSGWRVTEEVRKIANKQTQGEIEPVIVPPSWSKGSFYAQLTSVWKRASHELSEAETITVIGYSLPETDVFFRHLFALGTIGAKPIRDFTVIDPNPAVFDRFRTLLGVQSKKRFIPKLLKFCSYLKEAGHDDSDPL